jgi:hypothetical protein
MCIPLDIGVAMVARPLMAIPPPRQMRINTATLMIVI